MPHIGEVAGEAAGHDEDGIDANVVAGAGVARRQPLRRHRDTPQAMLVEAPRRCILVGPLLHFDEGDRPAAPGDEVDFATGDARAAVEDAPAVEAQPPGGEAFRLATARFGLLPGQSRLPSSSARA